MWWKPYEPVCVYLHIEGRQEKLLRTFRTPLEGAQWAYTYIAGRSPAVAYDEEADGAPREQAARGRIVLYPEPM